MFPIFVFLIWRSYSTVWSALIRTISASHFQKKRFPALRQPLAALLRSWSITIIFPSGISQKMTCMHLHAKHTGSPALWASQYERRAKRTSFRWRQLRHPCSTGTFSDVCAVQSYKIKRLCMYPVSGSAKNFAEHLRSDLYILPSSIHEVLIIPVNSFATPADPLLSSANSPADTRQQSYRELSEMVQEVNATQLSTEDILSDHVYYYSRESSRITM